MLLAGATLLLALAFLIVAPLLPMVNFLHHR